MSLEVGRATPLFKLETHDPSSLVHLQCNVLPFEQGHEKLVQGKGRQREIKRERKEGFNGRGMKAEEGRESVLEEYRSLYFCRRFVDHSDYVVDTVRRVRKFLRSLARFARYSIFPWHREAFY